jgi:cell wall-associated NlpC family hydrolase
MSSPPRAQPLLRRPRAQLPGRGWLLALGLVALAGATAAVVALASGGARAPVHRAGAHARARLVAEVPDPLASQSFPDPAGALTHARAAAPSVAAASVSPGAPSLAQVKRQLAEERQLQKASQGARSGPGYIDPVSGAFTPAGVVPLPISEVIAGGNAIADFPYVYGGGHASFVDRAYDCSGSVSYALAAARLIAAPETSGQLEHWGKPGPGRWLTIFANAGHTFMIVDGVWFDTAGRAGPHSTRWLRPTPSLRGYVVRHYPGL